MQPTEQDIIKAYNIAKETGADSTCKVLEALYPDVNFTPVDNRPVEERIKTFADAVAALGNDHPCVQSWNSVFYEGDEEVGENNPIYASMLTYLKLCIIAAALNEGWEPQFSEDEYRWYPWFVLYSADELAEKSDEWKAACTIVPLDNYRDVGRSSNDAHANGGLVYAFAFSASSYSHTSSGARLAFKTEALANYAARQFAELWADFYLIRK